MKTTRLLSFCFLISVRRIVQSFLAFFRFSEADACVLLSAHGLHGLEVDRLQNSRPNERNETNGSLRKLGHRKRTGQPPQPISIGIHPDFIQGNWTTASKKRVH
jgi:hypothetical protein